MPFISCDACRGWLTVSNACMKERPMNKMVDLFAVDGIGEFKKCFPKF